MNTSDGHPSKRDDESSSSRSLLNRLSQLFLREPASRSELLGILREAQKRDLLDRDALDMIEGVLQVSEMQVRDIMIPRAQMHVVDKNQTPDVYLPMVIEEGHSRYPMIDADKDKVVGILLAKDLLRYFQLGPEKNTLDLDDILRPVVYIPESKRLDVLLRDFRAYRNHMAIVVDEYGGVSGLVTIEDVLEQIVGEIEDEHDVEEDDALILQRDENHFVVKALLPLEDFNAHFDCQYQVEDVDTVGGLILSILEHVPKRGETVELDGLQLKVLRADSRRVHLVEVFRQPYTDSTAVDAED